MIFFVSWHVVAEQREQVLARFASPSALPPEGARIVGRWHRLDGTGGWMVMEAESMHPITEFTYEWSDLLFGEIIPVANDADVGSIVERLRTKRL